MYRPTLLVSNVNTTQSVVGISSYEVRTFSSVWGFPIHGPYFRGHFFPRDQFNVYLFSPKIPINGHQACGTLQYQKYTEHETIIPLSQKLFELMLNKAGGF